MYIEDGSNTDYDTKEPMKKRYSWGWIGDHIPPDKVGWADATLKKRIIQQLKEWDEAFEWFTFDGEKYKKPIYRVKEHCGWHDCEICLRDISEKDEKRKAAKNYEEWLKRKIKDNEYPQVRTFNGSFLIQHNGLEFRCPAGVHHYVEDHDYNPGDIVIEAILNGDIALYKDEEKERKKELEEMEKRMEEEAKKRPKKSPYIQRIQDEAAIKVEQLRKAGAFVD